MIIKCNKLISEFRASRGQVEYQNTEPEPSRKKLGNKPKSSTPYESFLKKYEDIENNFDNLGTRDLVYYFREVAESQNFKYVISNIKKDMAIMKRLRETYSNMEICAMIEFLFHSEQDYLDKSRLSINLLASQWINTIYADTKLWIDDKYIPKSKAKHKNKEWTEPVNETSSIGDWEE